MNTETAVQEKISTMENIISVQANQLASLEHMSQSLEINQVFNATTSAATPGRDPQTQTQRFDLISGDMFSPLTSAQQQRNEFQRWSAA